MRSNAERLTVSNLETGSEYETDGNAPAEYTVAYSYDLQASDKSVVHVVGYETYDESCQSTKIVELPTSSASQMK